MRPAAVVAAILAQRRRADPLRFPDLSLVVVKLTGSGEYVVERPGGEPSGHFGLAVRDETHGTAPMRRFPDLITQSMVKGELLLQSHVGQQYDAIVTAVSDTDTWVRVFAPHAQGRLEAGAQELKVGRQVWIRLVSTNVERGFIDFVLVD